MELLLAPVLWSAALLMQAREWIGLLAAVLAAVLAARAGWHLTDWVLMLRQRADED